MSETASKRIFWDIWTIMLISIKSTTVLAIVYIAVLIMILHNIF